MGLTSVTGLGLAVFGSSRWKAAPQAQAQAALLDSISAATFELAGNIIVTGATGQVGPAVIAALPAFDAIVIRAAVRDEAKWRGDVRVQPVRFDYSDPASQDAALADCDSLFLLRPPELTSDFGDLIARAKQHGVKHIVFLSVQGAGSHRFIPHHKIEAHLVAGGAPYTLLRPAYFMQNFTSTLHDELVRRHRIFLPAGSARFTLVDIHDIGRVAAHRDALLLPRAQT